MTDLVSDMVTDLVIDLVMLRSQTYLYFESSDDFVSTVDTNIRIYCII